jgi:sec-independent protein translocase protein TatA
MFEQTLLEWPAFSFRGRHMGSFSIWHWLVVLAVVLLLFGGRGKLSGIMGDFAKGLKAFKAGMKEDEPEVTVPPAQVPPPATATTSPASAAERQRERA